MTDNAMLAEPTMGEGLILYGPDLTCANPACVVCGPVVEAVAAAQTGKVSS